MRPRTDIIERIAGNQQRHALSMQNFWALVDIDIKNIGIDPEVIKRIHHCLNNGIDFGLKNEEGGIVYFINPDIMITWHPTDVSARSVIKINATDKAFMNNLKLIILGHREFISNYKLKFDKIYLQITNSLS